MLNHVIIGDGKPILILHGSTLDHRHLMETLEPIVQRRDCWQRVYVDMPGLGKSPPQDEICTQDDLLAAVAAFARDVFADRPFAIA